MTDRDAAIKNVGAGDKLVAAGEYKKALEEYKKALANDPENALAHHGIGIALMYLYEYESAISYFRDALEIKPLPESYRGLANALSALRRYREAASYYINACDIYAKSERELRTELEGGGQIQERPVPRIELEKRHEEAKDACADSYSDLGYAHFRLREYDTAIAQFQIAIDYGDRYPYSYHNLATLYWKQGKYEEALDNWEKAATRYENTMDLAMSNKWTGHFLYYGNLLHEVFGNLDKAESVYKQGLSIGVSGVNKIEILASLVYLYIEKKDEAGAKERSKYHWEAKEHYEKALYLLRNRYRDKADIEPLLIAGKLHFAMKKDKEAREAFQEALDTDKENAKNSRPEHYTRSAEPCAHLGMICARSNDARSGIEFLTEAVEIDMDDLSLRSNFAEAHMKNNSLSDAQKQFLEILDIAPNHLESILGMAEVYTLIGDSGETEMFDLSIRFFNRAIDTSKQRGGSKRLKRKERASVFYSRGYAVTRLYDSTKTVKDLRPLYRARNDFRECFKNDSEHLLAKRGIEKIDKSFSTPRSQRWLEKIGPWLIFIFSGFIFSLAQYYLIKELKISGLTSSAGESFNFTSYSLMTFGSLMLMAASVYLPQVLKLKFAGLEIEKSAVESLSSVGMVGISKSI